MKNLLVLLMFSGLSAPAATYYIDFSAGNDTNTWTSKSAPWKRAPGMNGCTANCATAKPAAGDSFIFKGGVTWPNEALGWNWIWRGTGTTQTPGCTGSGCIYVGVDKSWFAGPVWTRPKLDAGKKTVKDVGGGANILLRIYANYVIFDNLEFTGLYWTGVPSYGTSANIQIAPGSPGIGVSVELKNLYIHGWSHNSYASGTREIPCGIVGDTAIPNNNANSIIHNSIIDGSDTSKDSCSAIFGGPPYIVKNYIRWVTSGMIVNGTTLIDSNTIMDIPPSFDTTAHTNGIEINASRDVIVSNNVIANLGSGTLGIWVAANKSYTSYVYNNVMYNTDTGNVVALAAPVKNNGCEGGSTYCREGGAAYVANNTIQCGPDTNPRAVCAAGISSAVSAVTLVNNHWITNATTPNGGMWSTYGVTPTTTTNLLQSQPASNATGYGMSQSEPFSPTNTASPTVNVGSNMTHLCSTIPTLCRDTTLGVIYDSVTQTVAPRRPTSTRPQSGPWVIGAYNLGATGDVNPTPATALSATVR